MSQPAGSAAVLSDAGAVQPTLLLDRPGVYSVQLIVHDGQVASAPATVTLATVNAPPVASAGAEPGAVVGAVVTLDGSGSFDPDGDLLSYAWALLTRPEGSLAEVVDPTAVQAALVPDVAGLYVVQLQVHDGTAASAPATATVTATAPPIPTTSSTTSTTETSTTSSTSTSTLPATARIVPDTMSLVVGEQRPVQVIDGATGAVLPDVPLTSSAPAVASVAAEGPATVTGLTPGAATLSAGTATAAVTVFPGPVLPPGTIRWTAPSDGSGVVATAQAIPSDNPAAAADLFTLEASGRVQALTAEGTLVWASHLPPGVTTLMPDMHGGVLGVDPGTITRLDPATGQTSWVYAASGVLPHEMAVHPDGTILFLGYTPAGDWLGNFVVGLDGETGAVRFHVPLENSTITSDGGCEGGPGYAEESARTSRLVVTADGATYLASVVDHLAAGGDCVVGGVTTVRALTLLRIAADGSATVTPLHTWTGGGSYEYNGQNYDTTESPLADVTIETLIAPGEDAVTLAWAAGTPGYTPWCNLSGCADWVPPSPVVHTLTLASAGGIASEAVIEGQLTIRDPMAAGENGVLFAPARVGPDAAPALVALASSGAVLWTEPGLFEPIAATQDGGIVARQLGAPEQVVTFGAPGGPSAQTLGNQPQYSWLGDWYGTLAGGAVVASVAAAPLAVADSAWAMAGANPSASGAATHPITALVREQIALLARTYAEVASENWLYAKYGNEPTCNFFVHDVIKEGGVHAPGQPGFTPRRVWRYLAGQVDSPHYPAVAATWASPNKQLKCWDHLPDGPDGSSPGDVIAQAHASQNATGHVGIIVAQGQTASATDVKEPKGIIDRNDWGFRAGDPTLSGAKSGCTVKRFVCY